MALDPETLSLAMSNLGLISDKMPTHMTGDLDKSNVFKKFMESSKAQEKDEAFYMLATYCFDLSKRFAILHNAVRDVCKEGTPNSLLAQLINEDDRELNEREDITWKQRSEIAGKQLKKWHERANTTNEKYIEKFL